MAGSIWSYLTGSSTNSTEKSSSDDDDDLDFEDDDEDYDVTPEDYVDIRPRSRSSERPPPPRSIPSPPRSRSWERPPPRDGRDYYMEPDEYLHRRPRGRSESRSRSRPGARSSSRRPYRDDPPQRPRSRPPSRRPPDPYSDEDSDEDWDEVRRNSPSDRRSDSDDSWDTESSRDSRRRRRVVTPPPSDEDDWEDVSDDELDHVPSHWRSPSPAPRGRTSDTQQTDSTRDTRDPSPRTILRESDYTLPGMRRKGRRGKTTTRDDTFDPRVPTSGESLVHPKDAPDRMSDEEANEKWKARTQVTREEAEAHAERLSGDRYEPSIPERYPTVHTRLPSILRKPDPNAKDLSCLPMAEWKKRQRVGLVANHAAGNYWKREVPEDTDLPAWGGAQHLRTIDSVLESKATALMKTAGMTHAPTSEFTMEEYFPTMYTHDISGLDTEFDPDADTKLAKVFSTLNKEDKTKLGKELQRFTKLGLVWQKYVDWTDMDLLKDRGSLAWMKTDKYLQKEHAGNVLQLAIGRYAGTYDPAQGNQMNTIICSDQASRRRFLDTGGPDKDGKPMDIDGRTFQSVVEDGSDPVGDRDYTTDFHNPRGTDYDTVEAARAKLITGVNSLYDALVEQDFEKHAGGSAPESIPTISLWHRKQWARSNAEFDQLPKQKQTVSEAHSRAKKVRKSARKAKFYNKEEWAEAFPYLSKYRTHAEAVTASEEDGRQFWREVNKAGAGHVQVQIKE